MNEYLWLINERSDEWFWFNWLKKQNKLFCGTQYIFNVIGRTIWKKMRSFVLFCIKLRMYILESFLGALHHVLIIKEQKQLRELTIKYHIFISHDDRCVLQNKNIYRYLIKNCSVVLSWESKVTTAVVKYFQVNCSEVFISSFFYVKNNIFKLLNRFFVY